MRRHRGWQGHRTAWQMSEVLRRVVYSPPFQRRKHGLTRFAAQDSPTGMETGSRHPRARTCGPRRISVALASLLALIALTTVASTAGASAFGDHRNVVLAKQSTTKTKTMKKKKATPPTIKMKLLGSVASESPDLRTSMQGWLYTDGVRWAAYEPTAGLTRLIETIKNKTVERTDPEGCADGLIAMGGGEMLYSCEDPECPEREHVCPLPSNNKLAAERYVVEDIASGEQHSVAGENTLLDNGTEGGPSGLYAIGSQWARGEIGSNVSSHEFFLNWHTGRSVSEEDEGSENSIENLSSPNLAQRLCEPITRPKNKGEYQSVAYSPLEYEPPFATVGPLEEAEVHVRLQLRKCGSSKREFLPAGGGVQLGGRVLSGGIAHGPYVTQLHAKGQNWHGPYYKLVGLPSETQGVVSFVQHTSNTVFATSDSGPGPARVYLARLPWVQAVR